MFDNCWHKSFFTLTTALICLFSCSQLMASLQLSQVKMPPGFKINLYASGLDSARSLALSPDGTVIVGSRKAGNVYALQDKDGDGVAEIQITLAKNLNSPNGVAFNGEDLFVAETGRVLIYPKIREHLKAPPAPQVLLDNFPTLKHHGNRYLAKGPDGYFYIAIGAPCNVCLREDDKRFATIMRFLPDGKNLEVFAHGVRSSLGFDWHPETKEMWFTENGRDLLGDHLPPDELNRASTPGLHFGFPFCHGEDLPDPLLNPQKIKDTPEKPCGGEKSIFTPPAKAIPAHVATLGIKFYTGKIFPKKYQQQIFIAEHGSWNSSKKVGYKISLVILDPADKGKVKEYLPFATGFLSDKDEVLGRPVDLLNLPDGSLLVSDDFAGALYRISYSDPAAPGKILPAKP